MRSLVLLAAICSASFVIAQQPPAAQQSEPLQQLLATAKQSPEAVQQAQAITPSEAISMFGTPEIVVRMQVKKSKDRLAKRGIIFLDSEGEFDSPKNLGIALSAKVAEEFKQQGIDDLPAHLAGRTIEVTGCIMQFEQRIYLPVLSSHQLKIIPLDQ